MANAQLRELLLQSLEHERGGVLVYQTALECAVNKDLRKEWEAYLEQTENHVEVLTNVCTALGLDPNEMTPGRKIVQNDGKSLVLAMKTALGAGDRAAAELVACEHVVLAETKDHADWELIGQCAKELDGEEAAVLKGAYEQVEDEKTSTSTTRKAGVASFGSKPSVLRRCFHRRRKRSTSRPRSRRRGRRSAAIEVGLDPTCPSAMLIV